MFPAVKVFSAKQTVSDRCPGHQRGFLLMTSVVLIVIAALLLSVMVFLGVTGNESSVGHSQSGQALFIAETGLERALRGYNTGTACNSLTYNGNIGQGSFSTTGTSSVASIALGANITAADTVIPVASTAGFASHGRIRIENEDIDYAAITATTFTGARRGVAGSTAVAHNTGATVNVAQDQCMIRSTGTVTAGNAKRVVEKGLQNPGAMIVYSKDNPAADRDVPFFRRWDGTNWGPERQANAVGGDQRIRYMVLKFARTRNEAILGTLQENGDIEVQVWNGTTQTWGAVQLLANVNAGDSEYRSFDIEYETTGDRALVVYNDNTADPDFVIWDGTAWSVPADINLPTGAEVRWIELAPHPTTNEIAMITLDNNYDVKGMRWTGAVWDEMPGGLGVWDTSAADNCPGAVDPCKVIDVAYEQLSGRAMFMWGDNANGLQRYRIWNGATLTLDPPVTLNLTAIPGPDMTGEANWIRLVARPNSNELMYGVQDENRDLFTARWTGAAPWVSPLQHDANTEDTRDRNFDIVYETNPANPGFAWLLWGSRVGADFSRRCLWNGAAWCGAPTNFGDDAALVQLAAHPVTGVLYAGIYQDSGAVPDDITTLTLAGGAWSAESILWGGPTVGNPVNERVNVASERASSTVDWREIFP